MIDGIPFDEIGPRKAVHWVLERVRDGQGGYVCTPNVDYVVKARRHPAFRRALLDATLRLPDGKGILVGSLIAGAGLRAGVTGRRLPVAVARALAPEGRTVALFGAGPGIAERAGQAIEASGGLVADAFGPGRPFQIGSEEDLTAVARLRAAGSDVIFCALGAPIQELWMNAHHGELAPAVLIGVGAAFDVLSGRSPEPPAWATDLGLEWLFRLAREPRRLGRRYLRDDPRFFWWMLQARLRNRSR